ncbi:MAG: respiratory nitrate reductase subunit gamma [Burkholderiaceae bacterium]
MTLAHYIDAFVLGIFPYIALAVMLIGSLLRYVLAPYTWKSASSEIWSSKSLRLGSNLFHIGVLGLFFGHIGGLFTPLWLFDLLRVTPVMHQWLEVIIGSFFMLLAIVGLIILLHRRLTNSRVRATSRPMDIFIDGWLLLTLLLGAGCVSYSALYDDTGASLIVFGLWARGVVMFQADAWTLMVDAPLIYKLHIFSGFTVFLLLPFTRLVHIWSGFATVLYIPRRYQLMRRLG